MPLLFERTGLEQDTGLLKPRYLQDDASITSNVADVTTGNITFLTVTTGKKYYLTAISGYHKNTDSNTITVKDDTTNKAIFSLGVANTHNSIVFDTPLEFSTSVVLTCSANTASCTIMGWEE